MTSKNPQPFEKLIRCRALGAGGSHVGFEPRDLTAHKLNARGQLLNGKQAEVLPDLVRHLLLRSVVVIVECRHGLAP
jgi:hypothetical protein